jgi:hypothetical protein
MRGTKSSPVSKLCTMVDDNQKKITGKAASLPRV